MSKIAPTWFWIVYGLISIVAITIFIGVNMSVGAFFTPVSELPLIYWLLLSIIIILLSILLRVLFIFIRRSQIPQSRTGLWVAVIGNAIASTLFIGVFLLYVLITPELGGTMVFFAVLGTFSLAMAGILSAKLDRVRKGR